MCPWVSCDQLPDCDCNREWYVHVCMCSICMTLHDCVCATAMDDSESTCECDPLSLSRVRFGVPM